MPSKWLTDPASSAPNREWWEMIIVATFATPYFWNCLFTVLKVKVSWWPCTLNLNTNSYKLQSETIFTLVCQPVFTYLQWLFLSSDLFPKAVSFIFNGFRLIISAPTQREGTVLWNQCCRAVIRTYLRWTVFSSYKKTGCWN